MIYPPTIMKHVLFFFLTFLFVQVSAQEYYGSYKVVDVSVLNFKDSDVVNSEDMLEYKGVNQLAAIKLLDSRVVLTETHVKLIFPNGGEEKYTVENVMGNRFTLSDENQNQTLFEIAAESDSTGRYVLIVNNSMRYVCEKE